MKNHFINKYFSELKEEESRNEKSKTKEDLAKVEKEGRQVIPKRRYTFKTFSVEKKTKNEFPRKPTTVTYTVC